jgi:hypothetical protein
MKELHWWEISAMFFDKKFNSLEIARQIIQNTGLDENLGILKQKKHSVPLPPRDILKLVMALCTCNLVQTMEADFIVQKLSEDEHEAVLRDYILESFRNQDLVRLKAKDEIEGLRQEVMKVVGELKRFWGDTDPQGSGPGPRYYCVKEVLARLGGEVNYDLHDALFELMYLQYKHYLAFFRTFLAGST